MTQKELEQLVTRAITEYGGRVLHGELCILMRALGCTLDESRIQNAASDLAERGVLVKPQKGQYYLPAAWRRESPDVHALPWMPYGVCDAGRILYAAWILSVGKGESTPLNVGAIRRFVKDRFPQCKMNGHGQFTRLCEDGYLDRTSSGFYALTSAARDEIDSALQRRHEAGPYAIPAKLSSVADPSFGGAEGDALAQVESGLIVGEDLDLPTA